MPWPVHRPRRLRDHRVFRDLVRETRLSADDLIYPIFIVTGSGRRIPIASLPGQYRLSPDEAAALAEDYRQKGGRALLLFGVPDYKDETGSSGADPQGPVPQAIRAIKAAVPEMAVITDVCLCEYTSHGHCGIVEDGRVKNDPTLAHLARQALAHVRAGADMVAPSDMMDGRVGAIRKALDQEGFEDRPIMAYSVKYASSFYGPFREAAGSTPSFGDRRGYQMDPANRLEARVEAELDLAEGADIIMVKPAGPYLDIIREIRNLIDRPVAAYQVSGEMAMIKAAAEAGALDFKAAAMESLLGIKRAGADMILTYLAPEVLPWLPDSLWI
ncbi:MAG: porphobilinogen synthase [Deltaproteobacteria bacterium]|jgi:porphobilinogen synthase|nr:porphobilinogen synthase [Deltaproteobacteria bacterium]